MAFEIDSSAVKKYASIERRSPYIDTTLDGALNFGIHWTLIITFNTMTAAEWAAILVDCIDGATHTIKVPDPTTDNTETVYSNVRLRALNDELGMGLYVYGAQIEVTRVLIT